MRKRLLNVMYICMGVLIISGCQTVKPYQRVYLNDHEMQSGSTGSKIFERNVQVYREGATGGGGGKPSGGCGCN